MELCVPLTVDLTKDQVFAKGYGIEHISKLLEEELAQLKSLKYQSQKESVLPVLKTKNDRSDSEVEGLIDYHQRVENVKSRNCKKHNEAKMVAIDSTKTNIEPFSEISFDCMKGKRVLDKGEVPFFRVSTDKQPVSYRLPKLPNSQSFSMTMNSSIPLEIPHNGNKHKNISRRNERNTRSSGKLLKSQGNSKMKKDAPLRDSNKELTDSLTVQYCTMTARVCLEHNKEDKSRRKSIEKENNKTFHLACTREPIKNNFDDNDNDCSFCTTVYIHARRCSQHFNRKNRQEMMSTKSFQAAEKTVFPQIKSNFEVKPEVGKKRECEKCRKRLQQAEQNRTNSMAAGPVRKNDFTICGSRKTKIRPTNKDKTESSPNTNHDDKLPFVELTSNTVEDQFLAETKPPNIASENLEPPTHEEVDELPLMECTAYMHEDGSLFLLPGAFTLHNKDYNIWSRTVSKHNDQKLSTDTDLPNIT